jgi:hypothetical protein
VGTSLAVCGFPKKLLWKGWCLFLVQLLIKNFIAPVALLFRHALYVSLPQYSISTVCNLIHLT